MLNVLAQLLHLWLMRKGCLLLGMDGHLLLCTC